LALHANVLTVLSECAFRPVTPALAQPFDF
jgi:hypothetical protein